MTTTALLSRIGPREETLLLVALTVALAACSAGGQTAPGPTVVTTAGVPGSGPAPTPVAVSPAAATGAGATPRPTEVPGPPIATLAGGTARELAGQLGTFTWDGLGSDAPWIVPPGALPATTGERLAVTLEPALVPQHWTARWAPVVAGSAGDPVAIIDGADAGIDVNAPERAGTWGLQVEATFAGGRRAAWYWSVDVAP